MIDLTSPCIDALLPERLFKTGLTAQPALGLDLQIVLAGLDGLFTHDSFRFRLGRTRRYMKGVLCEACRPVE